MITASGPVSLNAANAFTGPVIGHECSGARDPERNGDLNLGAISASSLDATAGDELLNSAT